MKNVIHVLSTFKDKRSAIRIVSGIERQLSRYLVAITLINAGQGVAVGLAMWLLGMPNTGGIRRNCVHFQFRSRSGRGRWDSDRNWDGGGGLEQSRLGGDCGGRLFLSHRDRRPMRYAVFRGSRTARQHGHGLPCRVVLGLALVCRGDDCRGAVARDGQDLLRSHRTAALSRRFPLRAPRRTRQMIDTSALSRLFHWPGSADAGLVQ